MKARYPSFLGVLIMLGFANFAFPNEEISQGKPIHPDQYLHALQELVDRLDSKPQQKTVWDATTIINTAKSALNETIQPLFKAKAEPRTRGLTYAQELGFDTGIKGAAVRETPFAILEVGLNDLRNFAPSKDARIRLRFTNQLLFPVEVNGQVKSSLTIRAIPDLSDKTGQHQNEGGWQLTRWGQPKLIQRLVKEEAHVASEARILLKIPALNRIFLGSDDNGVLRLIPLVSDHIFTAGKSYSEHDIFKWLSAEAKNMDDSPR